MKILTIMLTVMFVVASCKFTNKDSSSLNEDGALKSADASSLSLEEQKILDGIHQDILGLKSATGVDPLIRKVQKVAAANRNFHVVQAYSLVMTRLRLFKGIFWRLRTVVDDCALCHVRAVGMIRMAYLRKNSMGPHFKAFLDYLVHPHDDVLTKDVEGGGQFASISELQNYMESIMFQDQKRPGYELPIVSMEKGALMLEDHISKIPNGAKFNFDMRVLAGLDLISTSKQNKTAVRANLVQVLSRMYRNMAVLSYFVNYNLDGLTVFFNKLVQVRGLQTLANRLLSGQGFTNGVPLPNTAKEFVGIINGIQGLGTVRTGQRASNNVRKSALFFYKATLMRDLAYNGLKSEFVAGKESYVTHPNWFDMNSADVRVALNQRKSILGAAVKSLGIPVKGALSEAADKAVADKGNAQGVVTVASNRTGSKLVIRPAALFGTVGRDGKFAPHGNLKVFLPNIPGGPYSNKLLTDDQKRQFGISLKAVALNYEYGKAHQWKDPTMQGIFPSAKSSNELMNIATEMRMNSGTRRIISYLPFL